MTSILPASQRFTRTGQCLIRRALKGLCLECLHTASHWQILLKMELQPGFSSPFQKGHKSLVGKMMSNSHPGPLFLSHVPSKASCFLFERVMGSICVVVWCIPHLVLSNLCFSHLQSCWAPEKSWDVPPEPGSRVQL